MRAMFPGRLPFVEIHRRFIGKLPTSVTRMSPGDFIRAVVAAIEIPSTDFKYGTSRLFFRTGGADFLRELQYADPDELTNILKPKMMLYWARESMLPAAVLGIRGRQKARERRAVVKVLHVWGRMWADRGMLRKWIRIANRIARMRRDLLVSRMNRAVRLMTLMVPKVRASRPPSFHGLRSPSLTFSGVLSDFWCPRRGARPPRTVSSMRASLPAPRYRR